MEPQRFVKSAESRSLWNYTLSPGWKPDEVEVLKKCMMKIGVGLWTRYKELGVLPGKTVAQLNSQTQRLLGQQATASFTGLHIDPELVFVENAKKVGPQYQRKSGMLVNTGGRITRQELDALREENVRRFGVAPEVYEQIELPRVLDDAKLLELEEMQAHNEALDARLAANRRRIDQAKARIAQLERLLQSRGVMVPIQEAGEARAADDRAGAAKEDAGGGGGGGGGGGEGEGDDDDDGVALLPSAKRPRLQ